MLANRDDRTTTSSTLSRWRAIRIGVLSRDPDLTPPWYHLLLHGTYTHGKCMIGVHSHNGAVISPSLLSSERYKWLHETHSRLHNHTDFTQDLLGLMSRYHPKAKSLNSQGRALKLANHWAIPPRLCHAIESTFLTTTELFGSPLNCSMSDGSTYCSAF